MSVLRSDTSKYQTKRILNKYVVTVSHTLNSTRQVPRAGAAVGLGHSGVLRPAYAFSPPNLSNTQGNRRSAPLSHPGLRI
jgi:hypothetical protein